jgi:hypothetical protein
MGSRPRRRQTRRGDIKNCVRMRDEVTTQKFGSGGYYVNRRSSKLCACSVSVALDVNSMLN